MRRRAKIGIVLGVVAAVGLGALTAVDRIAVSAAEGRITDQARQELITRGITVSGDPRVTIDGFPFLTQVMAGRYGRITMGFTRPAAEGVQFERIDLTIADLNANASDILNGTGAVVARTVTGTALLGWPGVRQILELSGLPGIDPSNIELTAAGGAVRMRVPVTVAGQKATVVADGTFTVEGSAVMVRATNMTVEGNAVSPVLQRYVEQYRNSLSASLKVPAMPYNLAITGVTSGAGGLTITARATDVRLAGSA